MPLALGPNAQHAVTFVFSISNAGFLGNLFTVSRPFSLYKIYVQESMIYTDASRVNVQSERAVQWPKVLTRYRICVNDFKFATRLIWKSKVCEP